MSEAPFQLLGEDGHLVDGASAPSDLDASQLTSLYTHMLRQRLIDEWHAPRQRNKNKVSRPNPRLERGKQWEPKARQASEVIAGRQIVTPVDVKTLGNVTWVDGAPSGDPLRCAECDAWLCNGLNHAQGRP